MLYSLAKVVGKSTFIYLNLNFVSYNEWVAVYLITLWLLYDSKFWWDKFWQIQFDKSAADNILANAFVTLYSLYLVH